MKNSTFIVIIIFTAISTYAQTPPDTLWTKRYGGTSTDDAKAVIQTFDSCFVVLGNTDYSGNTDIWLIKLDDSGNLLWDKTYGGLSGDYGSGVKQTTDQGFIILGTTESYGNGDVSIWLIKVDEDGNEQWNKVFDETIDNTCQAQYISLTSDGGYIITGGTGDFTIDHMDAWLIKTDEDGIEEWNKIFGGSGNQKMYTVFETIDGGYILSGLTQSNQNGGDAWLVKTDDSGAILWDKTFGGSEWDNAYSMQITSDNGYILAGYTKSYGNGEEDFWLIKTDPQGNEIWNEIYGYSQVDVIYSIQQTQDGGYIGGGLTNSLGNGGFDFWVVKTNANGEVTWDKTIGEVQDEFAFSVSQLFDQGFILAGRTNSYGIGDDDVYVVRIEPETTNAVTISHSENSFVNIFPNPCINSTTIEFDVKVHSNVTIKVYDLYGKELKTLIDGFQPTGLNSVVWDGTDNNGQDVRAGVYYCRNQIGNQMVSEKIVVLRF